VTGVAANYYIAQASSSAVIFAKPLGQWITAFVVLTIVTNFLSSGKHVFISVMLKRAECVQDCWHIASG
jgi:hypothetical protein